MNFLIKFFLGLIIVNYGLFHLAEQSETLENELLNNLASNDFKNYTPLKFENPKQKFDEEKSYISKNILKKTKDLLNKKYEGNSSFIERLQESEKLFKQKKFDIAELSYSKVFSSLYTIQKIQTFSRIEITKLDQLSFLQNISKTKKIISGGQLYRQIKLEILIKRVDCLIRLKRLHKMFFLLNLSYKLDEFSIIENHFKKAQLKLIYPRPYFDLVQQLSQKFGVKKELIYAIMREETHFNEKAKSHAGAMGLMQIMPATAKELHQEINRKYPGLFKSKFNVNNLWNFELNIIYGVYYLSKLQKKYKEQQQYMVAAYNAGPAPVKRWKKCSVDKKISFEDCVSYKETRSYLDRVLSSVRYYQMTYNSL